MFSLRYVVRCGRTVVKCWCLVLLTGRSVITWADVKTLSRWSPCTCPFGTTRSETCYHTAVKVADFRNGWNRDHQNECDVTSRDSNQVVRQRMSRQTILHRMLSHRLPEQVLQCAYTFCKAKETLKKTWLGGIRSRWVHLTNYRCVRVKLQILYRRM